MKKLPAGLMHHARQLRDEFPFVWLFTFFVPTTPDAQVLRVTNSKIRIPWGTTPTGGQIYFDPLPIAHSDITETTEGDLPQITLQIASSPWVAALMETYGGLKGAEVKVRLVNSLFLDDPTAKIEWDMRVIDPTLIDSKRLQVTLGFQNVTHISDPPHRYARAVCPGRVEYGGELCGFDLQNAALSAAHPTCDRSYDGPNGCKAHGDTEVANGLERKHPLMFGGRLAIPFVRSE